MRKFLLAATTLVAGPLLWASVANATLISVGFQEAGVNGGAITTVGTDAGTGSLSLSTSYGTFTANALTAIGYPALAQPQLNSASINVSSSTGGVLKIYVTETGLTNPAGINHFLSSFTSNLFNGDVTSVIEETLISTSNALYTGTGLVATKFTAIGTAAQIDATPFLGTYSETEMYQLTFAGAGDVNDTIDIKEVVPEPASLAIMGAGLIGLSMIRRRKAAKKD